MRPHQNSGMKEKKLVLSTDHPASSNYLKDVFCCTPLLHAVHHSKSNEKGTEVTRQLNTQLAKAYRNKSITDAYTSTTKYIQPMNKVGGSEPTSKDTKASSKTYKLTTSKSNKESSSKTKDAATSKTYEASSYKTKETSTSKSFEATTSTKEAASLADTNLPTLKSKKRKRSESKPKESKRHKSSHKHASSHSSAESTDAAAASSKGNTASLGPVASFHAPAALSKRNTASLGSTASSNEQVLISHAPNCDCPKPKRTNKEKTLLNTSISPIKKVVQTKGVQTDEKTTKNYIVETDEVKTQIRSVTKAVQTDNVIIVHVGSQTISEQSPDFYDDETLLLDTLPAPHSHSTVINLAKALQDIMAEKTSVLERLCPTGADVSRGLSQNDVLQKIKLITEDKAKTAEESPGVVKMEPLDGDLPNTSTEILVYNLYKDMMKAKELETSKSMKPEKKVTKRGLWKILDAC